MKAMISISRKILLVIGGLSLSIMAVNSAEMMDNKLKPVVASPVTEEIIDKNEGKTGIPSISPAPASIKPGFKPATPGVKPNIKPPSAVTPPPAIKPSISPTPASIKPGFKPPSTVTPLPAKPSISPTPASVKPGFKPPSAVTPPPAMKPSISPTPASIKPGFKTQTTTPTTAGFKESSIGTSDTGKENPGDDTKPLGNNRSLQNGANINTNNSGGTPAPQISPVITLPDDIRNPALNFAVFERLRSQRERAVSEALIAHEARERELEAARRERERSENSNGNGRGRDCDDSDAAINPSQNEICNHKDDNCNGRVDEGVLLTVYRDADGDGFGDPDAETRVCAVGDGLVGVSLNRLDCDDTDVSRNPAVGTCN